MRISSWILLAGSLCAQPWAAPSDGIAKANADKVARKEKSEATRQTRHNELWATHATASRKEFRRKGELLVFYRTEIATPSLVPLARNRPYQARRLRTNMEVVSFDETKSSLDEVRKDLAADADVLAVEPNMQIKCEAETADEPNLRNFRNSQKHLFKLLDHRRNSAKYGGRSNRKIKVGIMDSGLDFMHPDLMPQCKKGYNALYQTSKGILEPDEAADISEMDYNGHGTMVAGVIGASQNDFGIDGIDDNVELYGIKVLNKNGIGTLDAVIEGIYWAIENHMDVINMSFGNYERSAALESVIRQAAKAGIMIFASAGNDFADDVMYPADFDEAIAVGSYAPGGLISRFSNWGEKVEVFADGENVLSTASGKVGGINYNQFTGTSAATAQATGIACLLLDKGLRPNRIRKILEHGIPAVNEANPTDRPINILSEEYILAALEDRNAPIPELVTLQAAPDGQRGGIDFDYSVTNVGDLGTIPQGTYVDITIGDFKESVPGDRLGVVSPGRISGGRIFLPFNSIPDSIRNSASSYIVDFSFRLEDGISSKLGPKSITVYNAPLAVPTVLAMWVDPQRFNESRSDRTAYLKIKNTGSATLHGYKIDPGYWNGVHESVWMTPKVVIGEPVAIPDILPNEVAVVAVPVPGLAQPPTSFTLDMQIEDPGKKSFSYLQSHSYSTEGQYDAQYAQFVHVDIAKKAVELLKRMGLYIPDIHDPGSIYLDGNKRYDWGAVPNSTVQSTGYWDDAKLSTNFPGRSFTLVDGAWDADGIDPIYGYYGLDTWDTHFWISDNNDNDGQNASQLDASVFGGWTLTSVNHESAYTRIKSTLDGGATYFPKGVIDHYKNGYKKAAWWFLGQGVHLIGDLSLSSHVTEENKHGVSGDVYHQWMDKGNNSSMNGIVDGLNNFVDPYQSSAQGNAVRFLAYTTAQIGNSFPWYPLDPLAGAGKAGNRTAGGPGAHYDSYLGPIFSNLPKRPVSTNDISKNEVKNNITGSCSFNDLVPIGYTSTDCNGDGLKDIDNTDGTTTSINPTKLGTFYGTPLNDDGDITKIAQSCYPYAIQAAAGLIYYFAKETGQVRYLGTVPVINSVLLN